MTFNPKDHITKIKGKDYLEVKWRIVWFREEHPDGYILTEIINFDPLYVRANIIIGEDVCLATGHGTPKTQGVAAGRPLEGAETAAIGRALAHAGYGTQFTGEEEGEHLADSPVQRKPDPVADEIIETLGYPVEKSENAGIFATVKSSTGELYKDIVVDTLSHMHREICKNLKKDELTQQNRDELELKRDAAEYYIKKG